MTLITNIVCAHGSVSAAPLDVARADARCDTEVNSQRLFTRWLGKADVPAPSPVQALNTREHIPNINAVPERQEPLQYDRKLVPSPKAAYQAMKTIIDLECDESFDPEPLTERLQTADLLTQTAVDSVKSEQKKLATRSLPIVAESITAGLQLMEKWGTISNVVSSIKKQLEELQKSKPEDLESLKKSANSLLFKARSTHIEETINFAHQELTSVAPIFYGTLPEASFAMCHEPISFLDKEYFIRTLFDQQGQKVSSEQMKGVIAIAKNSTLLQQERSLRLDFERAQKSLLQARFSEDALENYLSPFNEARKKLKDIREAIVEPYPALKTLLPKAQKTPSLSPLTLKLDPWAQTLLELFVNKAPSLPIKRLRKAFEQVKKSYKPCNEYPLPLRLLFCQKLASFMRTVYDNRDRNDIIIAELGLTHEEKETVLAAYSYLGCQENPLMLRDAIDHLFFKHPDWPDCRNIFISATLHKSHKDIFDHFILQQHTDSLSLRRSLAISSEENPAIYRKEFSLFKHQDVVALIKASGKTLSQDAQKKLQDLENNVNKAEKQFYEQASFAKEMLAVYTEDNDCKSLKLVVIAYKELTQLEQMIEQSLKEFCDELKQMLINPPAS